MPLCVGMGSGSNGGDGHGDMAAWVPLHCAGWTGSAWVCWVHGAAQHMAPHVHAQCPWLQIESCARLSTRPAVLSVQEFGKRTAAQTLVAAFMAAAPLPSAPSHGTEHFTSSSLAVNPPRKRKGLIERGLLAETPTASRKLHELR